MTLRRFNNGLSMVVILLCLYVLLAPLFPNVAFWWRKSVVKTSPPLVTAIVQGKEPDNIPAENTLVIPKLNMQQQVHEGKNAQWALAKGVWRDPKSSAPGQGGNAVFTGHRFTYAGAAVFYHLDKVQAGDDIVIYWGRQKHTYRVQVVRVVPPTDASVIAQTDEETLTLYTCTPLITAKNRLAVIAKPVKETP